VGACGPLHCVHEPEWLPCLYAYKALSRNARGQQQLSGYVNCNKVFTFGTCLLLRLAQHGSRCGLGSFVLTLLYLCAHCCCCGTQIDQMKTVATVGILFVDSREMKTVMKKHVDLSVEDIKQVCCAQK